MPPDQPIDMFGQNNPAVVPVAPGAVPVGNTQAPTNQLPGVVAVNPQPAKAPVAAPGFPDYQRWLESKGFPGDVNLGFMAKSMEAKYAEEKAAYDAQMQAQLKADEEKAAYESAMNAKKEEQLAFIQEAKNRSLSEKERWQALAKQYAEERANVGQSAPIMELQAAMEGKRESAAAAMLRDQANTIAKQTVGQAYARGANPAVARAALMSGAEAQQTAMSQAAVIRAQEQATARQQWASAYLNQQGQLAQLQIQSLGGATNAEQLYQQALYTQVQGVENEKSREFATAMQNLRFEQQKELARIGQEWQQAQQEAAKNEALLPAMFQGAVGGAAAGSTMGPAGAVIGGVLGAAGGYMTNRASSTAAPSYGYGQMATTAGGAALQYKASLAKNQGAATPPSTETALATNGGN